jgi:hypothetical protein
VSNSHVPLLVYLIGRHLNLESSKQFESMEGKEVKDGEIDEHDNKVAFNIT